MCAHALTNRKVLCCITTASTTLVVFRDWVLGFGVHGGVGCRESGVGCNFCSIAFVGAAATPATAARTCTDTATTAILPLLLLALELVLILYLMQQPHTLLDLLPVLPLRLILQYHSY